MISTKGAVSLLVGQCGIQVGDTVFDELANSYGNNNNYNSSNGTQIKENELPRNIFFDEKNHSRAILIDTEAKVVANTLTKSKYRKWKYIHRISYFIK